MKNREKNGQSKLKWIRFEQQHKITTMNERKARASEQMNEIERIEEKQVKKLREWNEEKKIQHSIFDRLKKHWNQQFRKPQKTTTARCDRKIKKEYREEEKWRRNTNDIYIYTK